MQLKPGSVILAIGHTLIFVDARIENYRTFVQDETAASTTIVLDSATDGIETITQTVAQYSDIENVHIIAHGIPGCLFLGNSELSLNTLQHYQAQIQTWFAQTTVTEPSLLLYGCNVAFGDAGEEFITKLHHLTHTNIAAAAHPLHTIRRGAELS